MTWSKIQVVAHKEPQPPQNWYTSKQHDQIKRNSSVSICSDPIKHHVSPFGKSIRSNKRSVPNKHTVSCNWNTRVITKSEISDLFCICHPELPLLFNLGLEVPYELVLVRVWTRWGPRHSQGGGHFDGVGGIGAAGGRPFTYPITSTLTQSITTSLYFFHENINGPQWQRFLKCLLTSPNA